MKVNWKAEIPLIALVAGMWLAAALLWHSSPDRFPMRWEMSGEVGRYGNRTEGLLALPAGGVLVYLLMLFLPRLDPGRLNYAKFAGAWYTIRASSLALLAVLYVVMILSARGVAIDMLRFIGLAVGAMLFVMGNVLGKIRPNWFVGVRTPWTLSSKRSWSKTHRLAGWVFVAGGLALMAAGLIGTPSAMGVAAVILAAGVLGAVVYSYFVWKSDPDRVPPAGTLPANDESAEGTSPR
jgi:uncharacterized membrane protein